MTTAHRPTFNPAKGREAPKGVAYHQRFLPAHTSLKTRQRGQGGIGGLAEGSDAETPQDGEAPQRDLRAELLQAEAAVRAKKNGGTIEDVPADKAGEKRKAETVDDDEDGEEDSEAKRRRLILEEAHDVDAESDDDEDGAESDSDDDNDDDDDDEEDEEAELMRELAKIKAERAEQRAKEEAEKEAKARQEHDEEIARGNPLLDPRGGGLRDFSVKRRWDDDVVFKNQARGTEEKKGREFVNDLLRSDFHKRFMSKYVR